MKAMAMALLVLTTILYILVIKKIFPTIEGFWDAIKHFSFIEFLSVLRGRVFDENIREAYIGLALVTTVAYVGIAYMIYEFL